MLAAARFLLGGLEQQRELALDVLEFAASGRHLELLEIASQLGQEHAKKRQQVPVLMQMLVAVAHDALLLQADAVAAGPGRGRRHPPARVW
jgi:hypothetical protein